MQGVTVCQTSFSCQLRSCAATEVGKTAFPMQSQNCFVNLSGKISYENASSSTLFKIQLFFFLSPKTGPRTSICFCHVPLYYSVPWWAIFFLLSYLDSVFLRAKHFFSPKAVVKREYVVMNCLVCRLCQKRRWLMNVAPVATSTWMWQWTP